MYFSKDTTKSLIEREMKARGNLSDELYIYNDADRPAKNGIGFFLTITGDTPEEAVSRFFYLKLENGGYCLPALPGGSPLLHDFGIDIKETLTGDVEFNRNRESGATYADGSPRKWQGEEEFTIPYAHIMERITTKALFMIKNFENLMETDVKWAKAQKEWEERQKEKQA